jgi:NitT/TauT family transport system permease protein
MGDLVQRAESIPLSKRDRLKVARRRSLGIVGSTAKAISGLVFIGIVWQIAASMDIFPKALFPNVHTIMSTTWDLIVTGILPQHIQATLYRLGIGLALAAVVGIITGFLAGRSALVESIIIPTASTLLPIPALALVPLFILWFGLGNTTTILLVVFASSIPILFSTWTGVKSVPMIYIRAARSMNADGLDLYWKVIFPAALPHVLNGLRIGLGRAWRAVIAGEMIAATDWGLGYSIFIAREYLRTDVIMTGIIFIGITGLILEKLLFQSVENYTLRRWGMMQGDG